MRFWLLMGSLLVVSNASGQTPASKLWTELKAKREMLPAVHQEFEVAQTLAVGSTNRSTHHQMVLDMSQHKWREREIGGARDRIRIFDGQDLFVMEQDQDEYVRTKRKANQEEPAPGPYGLDLEWSKATEVERRPCGFAKEDHVCVILDVPVRTGFQIHMENYVTTNKGGVARLAIDTEDGILIQSVTQELIENQRGYRVIAYRLTVTYSLTRVSSASAPDDTQFKLPKDGMREVKELPKWTLARVKKQLIGQPAPELEVTDMLGNPVNLSSLKGKTVLLDFWASWCPPCVTDGPALDKLYRKYGAKDLTIIAISINEDREIVEKFLKGHPHNFPVVLTTENEIPAPYLVGVIPTYMVIAPDGTLTSAVEGDQSFGELRKVLAKADMEIE